MITAAKLILLSKAAAAAKAAGAGAVLTVSVKNTKDMVSLLKKIY